MEPAGTWPSPGTPGAPRGWRRQEALGGGAHTAIAAFQPPEPHENRFCCFKPPAAVLLQQPHDNRGSDS